MGKEFTDLFKSDPQPQAPNVAAVVEPGPTPRKKRISKAKWQGLLKVNVLLDDEQKDLLDSLAHQVMRNRSNGSERITANTFLRCLTDLLKSRATSLDLDNVADEDDLRKRLSNLLTK
jgi:hypothetical protein